MEKLRRRLFTAEFKIEAAKLVLEQGYSYAQAGKRLGVLPKLIQAWAKKYRAGELVGRSAAVACDTRARGVRAGCAKKCRD